MSVPNQKMIYGSVLAPCDKEHIFMALNQEVVFAALRNLTYAGFKMWMFFSKNQPTYSFELSRAECNNLGIDKNSYYRGLEELINKKYLIPNSDNGYRFYQVSQK